MKTLDKALNIKYSLSNNIFIYITYFLLDDLSPNIVGFLKK